MNQRILRLEFVIAYQSSRLLSQNAYTYHFMFGVCFSLFESEESDQQNKWVPC